MIKGQDVKATRILAKSLFKELRGNGYSPNQILSLSTELIELVTQDLRSRSGGAATRDLGGRRRVRRSLAGRAVARSRASAGNGAGQAGAVSLFGPGAPLFPLTLQGQRK